MEYITAEQFLEQSKEVQKVFLDYVNANISNYDLVQDENRIMLYKDFLERGYIENDTYPLFTEGQLRKFIENKTGFHIEPSTSVGKGFYGVDFYKNARSISAGRKFIATKETDLLQAYWQVALEIAKESVAND